MPRRDGTGPIGQGAMTGRRMGVCAGNKNGRGFGQGQGRGMGFRRGYGAQVEENNNETLKKDDLSLLKTQADLLEIALNNVKEKNSKHEDKN